MLLNFGLLGCHKIERLFYLSESWYYIDNTYDDNIISKEIVSFRVL